MGSPCFRMRHDHVTVLCQIGSNDVSMSIKVCGQLSRPLVRALSCKQVVPVHIQEDG